MILRCIVKISIEKFQVVQIGDFQSRRMNTKYKNSNNDKFYAHALNGSGIAVGRALLAILENYQVDKYYKTPKVLVKYMGGLDKIEL